MGPSAADGYYEGEMGTLFRHGSVRLRIVGGKVDGITNLGVPLTGELRFDDVRKIYRFELTAHLPPFHEAITGLRTGPEGRAARCSGETIGINGSIRFSIDFAGKAIDVALERRGPPEMAERYLGPAAG